MKVYLHIGMSKAGSSGIQRMMTAVEDQLACAGIIYPRTGRRRDVHYPIIERLRDGDASLLQAAVNEAKARGGHTVVISAEGLWLRSDAQLDLLRDAASGWDTEIILYLRRPADYLASSWRQQIKHSGSPFTQLQYLERVGNRMDYPLLLQRWAARFPLRAKSYESVRDTLELDFLEAIGTTLASPERVLVNETPSDGVTRLMLVCNRLLPEFAARPTRRFLLKTGLGKTWFSRLDNSAFREFADAAVQAWDLEVLRQFLPDESIDLLRQHSKRREVSSAVATPV